MTTIRLMQKPEQARQGDVLIVPITGVREEDVGKLITDTNKSRIVLAHGEATGHAHAFYPAIDKREGVMPKKAVKPVRLFELKNAGNYVAFDHSMPPRNLEWFVKNTRLLRLNERALLRHEEHHLISFPKGDYAIVPQCEYDDSEELRRVAD
jgi:hypothetical protein